MSGKEGDIDGFLVGTENGNIHKLLLHGKYKF
jgi:hypothetical protein